MRTAHLVMHKPDDKNMANDRDGDVRREVVRSGTGKLQIAFAASASCTSNFTRGKRARMSQYRVIDLFKNVIDPKAMIVDAPSPEKAAERALGVSLTRSGARRDLRARVYYQKPGQPMNMVRLYGRVADRVQA